MFCFTLITLILILYHSFPSDACDGNANAFIDEVLETAKPYLSQRIQLSGIQEGELKLWDIYAWGFDSIKRGGDMCFETKDGGKTVQATIDVFNIHGSSKGFYKEDVKVFGHKIGEKTFNFEVDADILHVKVWLGLDIDLNARKISLNELEFDGFDNAKLRVHVSGSFKPYNRVVSRLTDEYGNNELIPKAKSMIHDSFDKAVTKFNKFELIT